MSSWLWFSHRVCPSQLPSHPSCLPVSSFLHSRTHWGQHLDCAKVHVCTPPAHCSSLQRRYSKAKTVPRSVSPCWPCQKVQLTCEVSVHQSSASDLRVAGWLRVPTEISRVLRGRDGAAALIRQRRRGVGDIVWLHAGAEKKKARGGFSERSKGDGRMKENVSDGESREERE